MKDILNNTQKRIKRLVKDRDFWRENRKTWTLAYAVKREMERLDKEYRARLKSLREQC